MSDKIFTKQTFVINSIKPQTNSAIELIEELVIKKLLDFGIQVILRQGDFVVNCQS